MPEALDRMHARRLEQLRDEQKNQQFFDGDKQGGMAEAWAPPMLTAVSAEFGLDPRWARDFIHLKTLMTGSHGISATSLKD